MFSKSAFLLTAALLLPAASQAQKPPDKAPASCAVSTDGVFKAAMFDWGAGISYLDCYGPVNGNDTGSGDNWNETGNINDRWGGYGVFTSLGSSNDSGHGPFTSTDGSPLGFDSPISGYFALSLKQANFFSVYLFYAADPVSSINWDSRGVADNGGLMDPTIVDDDKNPKLSHAVLYAGPGSISTVPAPSSYLLIGSGLAGLLGIAGWRRRA